jgi:hypothetical protein
MWQNRCSESDRLFLAMVGQLVSWSVGGWSVGGWSVGGLVNSRGIDTTMEKVIIQKFKSLMI